MSNWQVIEGDCLEVMRGLPDGSVDFVFTDPPYGHNNNDESDLIARIGLFRGVEYVQGATNEGRPIANDGPEANDLLQAALPQLRRLLQPGCCCCCGGGGGPDPQFARWSLWIDKAFATKPDTKDQGGFKQMVVWDKGPMGMGWHYRRSYETVLVAQVPGAACRWYDDSNAVENIIRPGTAPKIIPSAEQHPTEKPWQLAAHFIRLHTQPGDLVLDPFCGSGSTGVAAVMLGRRFIGIELDPHFADMARRRIAGWRHKPPTAAKPDDCRQLNMADQILSNT